VVAKKIQYIHTYKYKEINKQEEARGKMIGARAFDGWVIEFGKVMAIHP